MGLTASLPPRMGPSLSEGALETRPPHLVAAGLGGSGSILAHTASPPQVQARETLIFVCSPKKAPLPQSADEAMDVSNAVAAHICRGASAEELRSELLRNRYRSFLFTGHGDALLEGADSPTLGFSGPNGSLEAVHADTLAELLGQHTPVC